MQKKLKVALDVDGVLRDFVNSLRDVYLSVYPNAKVGEVNHWELHRYYDCGIAIYDFAFHSPCTQLIFENAQPYINAKVMYDILSLSPATEVRIYTTQTPENYIYTLNWLIKHKFTRTSVVFEKNKVSDKWWDLIIEDKLDTIKEATDDKRMSIKVVRPWNIEENTDCQYSKSTNDLLQIPRLVKEFLNE